MGAIAVVLPHRGRADPDLVRRMCAAAPHRGTQVEALVHGRCALACVTTEAHDASVATVGDLAVAFTGSLDNAAEIERDLRAAGEPSAPASEGGFSVAALMAAAFRVHRATLPNRMRGVFAVAITDGERVWCFRDHIGYRPLFYRSDERAFYAASEAKQVLAGAGIGREPDLDVVEAIFFRSYDDETPSALVGVRRLPKATLLAADGDGQRLARYWHPEALLETARLTFGELQDRFATVMDQAVVRCMTGPDVISLSGGIDSPAVASFAAPRHVERFGTPLQAMSVVYPRYPSVDESRYVRSVADALEIPLHTFEQEANPASDLARWTKLADSPFPGAALAQYEEDYRRAHRLGFRTVLSGEHAEFVFAFGWNRIDHYLTHGRFGAVRHELAVRRKRGDSWPSLARLLARSMAPDRLLRARKAMGRDRHPLIPSWIDARKAAEEAPIPVRERWRTAQLAGFAGPGIALEAEEVCQAVCGVQARRPWTDVDVWELFLSLPAEQKFPDLRSKGLVRDLLRGRVPDEVLDRLDKTVFDEAALAQIDYDTLRRFLIGPAHRMPGVDYQRLADLLESERLTHIDYGWARELAGIHAFLSDWAA